MILKLLRGLSVPGFLCGAVLCLVLGTGQAAAYGESGGEGGTTGGQATAGLSNATTQTVVAILQRGGNECRGLYKAYRFDCFRVVYKRAADALAGIPAYREAFQALASVQKVLDQQVARNADPVAKPVRRGLRTYRAVKPAAVPRVEAASVASMQQAQTVLLRSGDKKGLHYAKIADAVNSNKVLLRSALLLIPGMGGLAAVLTF